MSLRQTVLRGFLREISSLALLPVVFIQLHSPFTAFVRILSISLLSLISV